MLNSLKKCICYHFALFFLLLYPKVNSCKSVVSFNDFVHLSGLLLNFKKCQAKSIYNAVRYLIYQKNTYMCMLNLYFNEVSKQYVDPNTC